MLPLPLNPPAHTMLNVVCISHMYPSASRPTNGGFIHAHVKALQAAHINVHVLCPVPWVPPGLARFRKQWRAYADAAVDTAALDGVPVTRVPYFTPPHPLHFIGAWTMAGALQREWAHQLADCNCDLIHAHTITPDGYAAGRIGKKLGLPVICSARGSEIHTTPNESKVLRRLTRRALANADGLIAVSSALADTMWALAPHRVRPEVIYNGVADCFHPPTDKAAAKAALHLPPTTWVVLFVGRCELDKGTAELINAFAQLNARDARLVIVGDGGARHQLAALALAGGISDRVLFAGEVPHGNITRFLHAADVFVLPTYAEGMPNALLEAMATGLPCIATKVGGIPEAITDHWNGILVSPKRAAEITHALREIKSLPHIAAMLGRHATQTVAKKFSWSANAARHLTCYQQLLATKP